MANTFTLNNIAPIISSIKKRGRSIVLVGGCFDILHIGHIKFLQEAKKRGDVLIVLLESDKNVKNRKGKNRPLFTQKERAYVISVVNCVDYVVMLPSISSDSDYYNIVERIRPAFIAVTEHDPLLHTKRDQAKKAGGKIYIIKHYKTFSSSRLAKIVGLT